ncbi:MAG: helix-turn-helix domain-containing protein [Candidatus Gastranaerophilales bacterium]|nr:helix-turn-helix domain-containing protein [Candidatus Gastranaerophilales bacterium]
MHDNKQLLEKIAVAVRAERFKQKISQERLAELAGLSVNFISNVENAKQDVRLGNLNAIAHALKKSIKDLI